MRCRAARTAITEKRLGLLSEAREAELRSLLEILEDDGPIVAHLSGTAGVGKSTLLSTFAEQA